MLFGAPIQTDIADAFVTSVGGDICLDWCAKQHPNLRADTHKDNIIMQNLLTRNGFIRCGIVYVSNGTARIAYQKIV